MIVHPYEHAWRYHLSHSFGSTDPESESVAALLAGPEGEEVRLNVKRGGAWLAERDPGWAEKIVAAVEAERFNLSSCSNCAVGTVLGNYDDHFDWIAADDPDAVMAEAVSLGFLVRRADGDELWAGDELMWAATEQAWVDYAYEQAAIR